MACEVALEDPGGVTCAFAFGDAAGDVVAGGWVVLAAVEHDRVQGAVELPVAAAAEAVACCDVLPAGVDSSGRDVL